MAIVQPTNGASRVIIHAEKRGRDTAPHPQLANRPIKTYLLARSSSTGNRAHSLKRSTECQVIDLPESEGDDGHVISQWSQATPQRSRTRDHCPGDFRKEGRRNPVRRY